MKCKYSDCGSYDIIKANPPIFDDTMGIACGELNPLASLVRTALATKERARLAINGKNRYYCRKCHRYFEA